MSKVVIEKCPYCNGTDFGVGYQQGQASIMRNSLGFSGSKVEYLICKECGSVVHSKVLNPKIFKSDN